MGEWFGGGAQLLVDHLCVAQQFLVDVQQQQWVHVGVEAFAGGWPLSGSAGVDEPLVGEFDASARAGVHTLGE